MWSVPNQLSGVRFLLIPVFLGLAWSGQKVLFFWLLVASLVTDGLDGYLARKLDQRTEVGAKLDSWADAATWLTLPLCGWWLRPEVLRQEALWLGLGLGSYLASIALGFMKYRRLVSYHTWGAKILAGLMASAALAFFAGGPGWVFRIVMPAVALSGLEEMLITLVLPEWRANVPTFFHALKWRRTTAVSAMR